MRLTSIQLGDQEWEFIWTCHHLMLDGWSCALVLEEVWDTYEKLDQDQPLPGLPILTYQAYLRWLKQQDQDSAAQFWQERLDGFTTPTPSTSQDFIFAIINAFPSPESEATIG